MGLVDLYVFGSVSVIILMLSYLVYKMYTL